MDTYAGGTQVRSGYYVDRKSFAFVNVEVDGTKLPGSASDRYLRVPVMAVMAAAPALGGLFVVALPFIGFGVAAYALARRVGIGARAATAEIAATITAPAVFPGEAHLTGSPGRAEPRPPSAPPGSAARSDAALDQLEKEIEEQRGTVY